MDEIFTSYSPTERDRPKDALVFENPRGKQQTMAVTLNSGSQKILKPSNNLGEGILNK